MRFFFVQKESTITYSMYVDRYTKYSTCGWNWLEFFDNLIFISSIEIQCESMLDENRLELMTKKNIREKITPNPKMFSIV